MVPNSQRHDDSWKDSGRIIRRMQVSAIPTKSWSPVARVPRMPRAQAALSAAVALTLAAAGCGGSSSPSSSSASQGSSTVASTSTPQGQTGASAKAPPTLALNLTIPVLLEHPLLGIPERYTCDGADISLPLKWGHIPPGTAELALFISGFRAVDNRTSYNWAVAGLKPTSLGVAGGRLPAGAVVGLNSLGKAGYSICPPKGRRETYSVKLFALPVPLGAQPGFDANTLFLRAEEDAHDVGLAAGAYERR
jgi:phosphatidylethanolamine-binding protein (PEBP) family uncharacterized protein